MFIADLPLYKRLTVERSRTFAQVIAPLLPSDCTMLDFGCGNMYTSLELLKLHPGIQSINGLDVVRDQNLSEERITGLPIHFDLLSTRALPYPNDRFDVVLALATMHHTEDPEYYFGELYRVVRPGGSIILIEEMYIHLLDKWYISLQDWMLNKLKHGVPVPLNFKSERWYTALFQKLGLTIEHRGSARPFPTFMHHYVYKLKKNG